MSEYNRGRVSCVQGLLSLSVDEIYIGNKLLLVGFHCFDEAVQPLFQFVSAVVSDDERHLELWMRFEVVELPGMEIGYEIAIVAQYLPYQTEIEPLWKVVQ